MERSIVETAVAIHAANAEKGFWDRVRPASELKILVVSELIEALEEARKEYPAHYCMLDNSIMPAPTLNKSDYMIEINDDTNVVSYMLKPEGEVIELADAAIRVLDIIGNLIKDGHMSLEGVRMREIDINLDENEMTNYYHLIGSVFNIELGPNDILSIIFSFAKAKNMDIWAAIDLKLEYNKTRPHKHGKKY